MTKEQNKGHHEKGMEKVKELLDKGIGMTEIAEATGLSADEVKKARSKWKDKS